MLRCLRRFQDDHSGATAVEYALIIAFVSVTGVTALSAFGANLAELLQLVADRLRDVALVVPR